MSLSRTQRAISICRYAVDLLSQWERSEQTSIVDMGWAGWGCAGLGWAGL